MSKSGEEGKSFLSGMLSSLQSLIFFQLNEE